jgi:hypothetical protein
MALIERSATISRAYSVEELSVRVEPCTANNRRKAKHSMDDAAVRLPARVSLDLFTLVRQLYTIGVCSQLGKTQQPQGRANYLSI